MQVTEVTATGSLPLGSASGTGVPRRIKGFVLTPAAAVANAVIRNNGAAGTVRLTLNAALSGTSAVAMIPGDALVFETDCHVTLTGAGALLYAFE